MRSSLDEDFVRVKTLMGLEPFEIRFFFRQKFTTLDLALKWLIKKLLRTYSKFIHDAFNDLKKKIVGCQKSYGNACRLKIFYSIFFFSYESEPMEVSN